MYKPEVIQHLSEIKIVENNALNMNKAATAKFGDALKIFFNAVKNEEENDEFEYDAV